jgi:hypothetical protein
MYGQCKALRKDGGSRFYMLKLPANGLSAIVYGCTPGGIYQRLSTVCILKTLYFMAGCPMTVTGNRIAEIFIS